VSLSLLAAWGLIVLLEGAVAGVGGLIVRAVIVAMIAALAVFFVSRPTIGTLSLLSAAVVAIMAALLAFTPTISQMSEQLSELKNTLGLDIRLSRADLERQQMSYIADKLLVILATAFLWVPYLYQRGFKA
jgi:hypothetical protein